TPDPSNVLPLRSAHENPDAGLPDRHLRLAPRRPDDREPHPAEQLGRPAHRPRPADRLHPGRALPRAAPAAQGGRPRSPATRPARTCLVTLDPVTRRDAAGSFFGEENVPQQALTMGVGTICEARKVVIMAFGEHKAPIVQKAVEGPITDAIAASFLQQHPDTTFIVDEPAAGHLTAVREPWKVGPVDWTPRLIRRAVISLCQHAG